VSAPVNSKPIICDDVCSAECGCSDCLNCGGCSDCGRGPTDVSDLPEPDCSYPVIVTDTRVHVIWVRASSQEDAVDRARYDTGEMLHDGETLASFDLRVRKPGDDFHHWDWETVYDGDYYGSYQGVQCDAHVETRRWHLERLRREAERVVCVAAGHPKIEERTYGSDRRWYCPTLGCGWFDYDPRPSAAGGEPGATPKDSDLGGAA
jgi:hypothetical protein